MNARTPNAGAHTGTHTKCPHTHHRHAHTQFFKQEDSTFNDAIALCLLLAILYAAYKAYATVLGA